MKKPRRDERDVEVLPGRHMRLSQWFPDRGRRITDQKTGLLLPRVDVGILYLRHHTVVVKIYHDPRKP
jgi:hypothetical protein